MMLSTFYHLNLIIPYYHYLPKITKVSNKGDQPWSSLEGMTLKLKLQYFGHLMQRVDSLEKTPMLGGIGGRRRRGRQRMMAGWHH